jgi:hypothetical protein
MPRIIINWKWFGRQQSLPARGNTPTVDHKYHKNMSERRTSRTRFDTAISDPATSASPTIWWRQQDPPQRRYICTALHGVRLQKTTHVYVNLSLQEDRRTFAATLDSMSAVYNFHSSECWYNATAIGPEDDGLPKSMQQIPAWKADVRVSLASQEIPRVYNSQTLSLSSARWPLFL